jgi:flavodoxin
MNRREFFRQSAIMLLMVVRVVSERPSHAAESPDVTVLVVYHSSTGNTEKMAQGVAEGAKAVSGTSVVLKRVGEVIRDDLLSTDAVIVGSPVYAGSISGQVKTFFDNWGPKFGLEAASRNMRNKVGAAFATGGSVSNGGADRVYRVDSGRSLEACKLCRAAVRQRCSADSARVDGTSRRISPRFSTRLLGIASKINRRPRVKRPNQVGDRRWIEA